MSPFIQSVYEKLQRHPKRIVFPEGSDPRVLQAAAEFVRLKLGPAIVLGEKEKVAALAAEHKVSLEYILVIDPLKAQDLPLFVRRLESLHRYKGIKDADAEKILHNPNYFAAMMLQNGQCDGLVAGASEFSGNILRPLFQLIKPLPGIKSISSCMVMDVPNCPYGDDGVFFFADAGVIPDPTVEQLADIAVETARLRRQLTGKIPRVAMLSYSTKGSAQNKHTEKIIAATALAKQKLKELDIKAEIDGEMQVDAALLPEVGSLKAPGSLVAGRADVLVFPDLNSGNIAAKLVQRLAKATAYGQILIGLSKPAAELSRGSAVQDILGVAALVALQAIEYRKLYPEQDLTTEDWIPQALRS
ncbi:MAG: phosphotransacetylase [Blastochloris sp.]|nr:phosphotransacetylase [Blastochloris sp.]